MIDLLIWLFVLLLIFGAAFYLIELIPGLPPLTKQIVRVILALLLVLSFLHMLAPGGLGRLPLWRS